jgi:hypothetical protein
MVVKNRLSNEKSEEYNNYKKVLRILDDNLKHNDNALITLGKENYGNDFVLNVYHSGEEYPIEKYVSITSHLSQIIRNSDIIKSYTTARVSGSLSFPKDAPDSVEVYDKYNLEL